MDVGGSGSVSRIFIIWIKAVFQINFISSYCSATVSEDFPSYSFIISSPGGSPGRAIILPPATSIF